MAGPWRVCSGRVGRRPGERCVEGPCSRIRSAPSGPVLERVEARGSAVLGGFGRRVGFGDADHGPVWKSNFGHPTIDAKP